MSDARRVRKRNPNATSALGGLRLGENPRDRLNARTAGRDRCAWPGCRERMQKPLPGGGTMENRYGVLCDVHAVDVAIAVVQEQRDHNRMWEFFKQQSTEQAVRVAEMRAEEERYEAEKAALRQDREGFVYYLRVGERIKVGYSVDVKRRMRAYPPGSELLAVEPGDKKLEHKRHRQFAASLVDGREWFSPTADLMELIDEIFRVYGNPKRFAHHYRRKVDPIKPRRDPGGAWRVA